MNTELSREEAVTCSLKYTPRIKKGKEVIRVFPDCMGTGLWNEVLSVTLSDLGINDVILEVAIRSWHQIWEFEIEKNKLTESAINRWYNDSCTIVTYLNKHHGDRFIFINQTDEVQPRISTNDLH